MTRRGMSKRKVRYAVVGLGHIAQMAILPAFRKAANSELFALVSGNSDKLEQLGKKYGLPHLYSYEDCPIISIESMRFVLRRLEFMCFAKSPWPSHPKIALP
jgi:hypothetical protein